MKNFRSNLFIRVFLSLSYDLHPAYFAMVMSTGIISISCFFLDMKLTSLILFWLNIVFYISIWFLTILRLTINRNQFFNDLKDHNKGPGFFTMIAGSCILGGQFIIIYDELYTSFILWIVSLILWIILNYTIFSGLTIKEIKPSLDKGISGSWLLAVVASQSIAVLSALIAGHVDQPHRLQLNFLSLCMWLWGGMLYIWMISLIFYRYTFFHFSPGDLSPPYWINMGAMAISTLAGSLLITSTDHAPFLQSILPFLKGFTILYWVTGTWWIPMLFILAYWRHVVKKFPLKYDPLYWGAVFPLGMYSASTYHMANSLKMEFLNKIPEYFIFIALAAWCLTFTGLIFSVYNKLTNFNYKMNK